MTDEVFKCQHCDFTIPKVIQYKSGKKGDGMVKLVQHVRSKHKVLQKIPSTYEKFISYHRVIDEANFRYHNRQEVANRDEENTN